MQLTRKITLLHLVLIQRKEISFSIKSQILQPAIKSQMFAHLIELYQMKHNIDNFPTLKLKNLRDGTPWTSNFKRTPPSPNNNQSIKRKHNPRMTNFQYQLGDH